MNQLYCSKLQKYIEEKYGLSEVKLKYANLTVLESYMRKLKPLRHVSMAKLIHHWIPMNDFLHKQHHSETYLCPQCSLYDKMTVHILHCNVSEAHGDGLKCFDDALQELEKINTSIHILQVFK